MSATHKGVRKHLHKIGDGLSPDGKMRGPESSPGYPEHVHPNDGPYTDVHVQTKGTTVGILGTLAAILTPFSEAQANNPYASPVDVTDAAASDLATTIDPFFITDAASWLFDLEPEKTPCS